MQINAILKRIPGIIIDCIYPRRCPFCGGITPMGEASICEKCKKKIPYIGEPRCKKCSKPVMYEEQEYCYDCSKTNHYYTRGIAVWKHKDEVKKSLYRFKYQNKREYAEVYAEEILRLHQVLIESWKADAIIPIPIHPLKAKERGFNQAEVLARYLSKRLNIPIYTDLVLRLKDTLPQKELNDIERRNNLSKAFGVANRGATLGNVILIDDIYTTGATINAVSKVLLHGHASQVFFISISIGEGI